MDSLVATASSTGCFMRMFSLVMVPLVTACSWGEGQPAPAEAKPVAPTFAIAASNQSLSTADASLHIFAEFTTADLLVDASPSSLHVMPNGARITYAPHVVTRPDASVAGPPATMTTYPAPADASDPVPKSVSPFHQGTLAQCQVSSTSPGLCTAFGPGFVMYSCPSDIMPADGTCYPSGARIPATSPEREWCCE